MMNILVLGGTRFFGIHMVNELIQKGHQVTIATRGRTEDNFANKVKRIFVERTNQESLRKTFKGKHYDVVCDHLAYCSRDVKYILESVKCHRYIMVSSTAVYDKGFETTENEFDGSKLNLKWCSRNELSYDEGKRQAECALVQAYISQNAVIVRYPFVIGEDDYTNRLYFYIEHIIKGIPMYVDNQDNQMGFIRSDEAGKFLAFLVEQEYCGVVNGSSYGTISIKGIANYVEEKTGIRPIFSEDGETAPYNGEVEYSINTDKAKRLGFHFSDLNEWIFDLIDRLIERAYRSDLK